MSEQYPEIRSISIFVCEDECEYYEVGVKGTTKIIFTEKCGSMAAMPYVQVYKNDKLFAEFCQHNIIGVYFYAEEIEGEKK